MKEPEPYLPEKVHFGDLSQRIADKLTVPIRRVPRRYGWADDNRPFEIIACSWAVYVLDGKWDRARFDFDLERAITDIATFLNTLPEVKAYPIVRDIPNDLEGIAVYDWRGFAYPIDVRFVCKAEQEVSEETGAVNFFLKFHITVLVEK